MKGASGFFLGVQHSSDQDDQHPVKSVLTNSIKGFYANAIKTAEISRSKGMSGYSKYKADNKYDFACDDRKTG